MVAKARKIDNASLRAAVPTDGILLHDISWDLYESLLRTTEEQHVRMTYDRGDLEIVPALLHDISWRLYEELLQATEDQHIRMTYDRGDLELMSPLPRHEKYKVLVRILIEELARELDMDIVCFGSMTCKREDLVRGLEPDECYYIAKAKVMWKKLDIDFSIDPPPDLAVEIDVTSNSLDRHGIYAALGVPELWRYNGSTLRVYHLIKGKYVLKKKSSAFPHVPIDGFESFIKTWDSFSQREWLDKFREWVRTNRKK